MANKVTLGPTGTRYGATMSVDIRGFDKVRANLQTLVENYPKEVGRAMGEECQAIMDESMRICPYDQDNDHEDGSLHLVETADILGPVERGGNDIVFILSYDTPYAVLQHEVQEYHHDAPEQWKYLEHPTNARVKVLATNLIRGVDMERMLEGSYKAQSWQDINADMKKWVQLARINRRMGGQITGRFA